MVKMLDENVIDVRGIMLLNIIRYVKKRRGADGVRELMKHVSELEGREISDKEIKEYEWYSHHLFKSFVFASARVFDTTPGEIATRLGTQTAKDLGFLRFFVKFTQTPEKIVHKSAEIWSQYHRIGKLRVVESKERRIVLRLTEYFGGPYFCNGLVSNIKGILEYTAKNVNVEESMCTSRGDPYCEFVITWE